MAAERWITIAAEFVELVSGRQNNCSHLASALAEAKDLKLVREPMVCSGWSYLGMVEALAELDKLSSTGKPLAPSQMGPILQGLGLSAWRQGSEPPLVSV